MTTGARSAGGAKRTYGGSRRSTGGSNGGNAGGGPSRREGGRRYVPRRRVCHFCADKTAVLDYKNVELMRRYVSDRGRIEPRRKTGTCARHQRLLARNLKWGRHLGLLPFTTHMSHESGIAR